MAARQLVFNWTPTLREVARAISHDDLQHYVQRVRLAGLGKLRQLKQLVDRALREEELQITDDDIPF